MSKQIFVLVVGHFATGKTTLTKEIVSELDINRINGDTLRDMMISDIKYYSDTHRSYPNEKIDSVNRVVTIYRNELVKELLDEEQSVIIDGAGASKNGRKRFLEIVKSRDREISTIIIETSLDEDIITERLKIRDKESSENRWLDFYKDYAKRGYELVDKSEADYMLKYDQNNSKEIIQKIRDILVEKAPTEK